MSTKKYLETFFKEKDLPVAVWEIKDSNGKLHIVNTEVVIEFIINELPAEQQDQVAEKLRMIDYRNGDPNHFLNYLAVGMVEISK